MIELRQKIDEEARRLGFDLVGVTTPDPPLHFSVFESWLFAGRHGAMQYLESERSRQRRADPRQIMPECRSILVLGIAYSPANERQSDEGWSGDERRVGRAHAVRPYAGMYDGTRLFGRVASYAWGDDYHDILVDRLRRLAEFIQNEWAARNPVAVQNTAGAQDANSAQGRDGSGVRPLVEQSDDRDLTPPAGEGGDAPQEGPVLARWYTDTGPLLERDLAQRAGLGWIGKNTCLIHPRRGSYLLLAELLLSIALEPDLPVDFDRCGTCTRCLEACPTGCILPDRTLDARRCLSYLTIELKGTISPDLRPQLGEWVFGCDICQQVCPWNRFAPPQGDPAFAPRPGVPAPDLVVELALKPEAFNRKFKGNPVRRAKRRGYLRNVVVALGNHRSPSAVLALIEILTGEAEPLVRGHAAWALGQIGGETARIALKAALPTEADPGVLAEIHNALSSTRVP